MNETWQPQAEDFTPAESGKALHQISRPSQSYWQDAWRRLRKNRRALASLYIVLAMLAFTLFGPLVWPIDPALQDLDSISESPSLGRDAMVVEDPGIWNTPTADHDPSLVKTPLTATSSLEVEGLPNTQFVRLVWEPVDGAAYYLVYRNDHEPDSDQDLGLPLVQTINSMQIGFEDRLQLKPGDYYYTIIASNGLEEAPEFTTKRVSVQLAITTDQALERGFDNTVGAMVRLRAHPFGTDYLGRDLLARMMFGARVSLFIGIFAPLLFVVIGVAYGGIAGYFGGNIDIVLMRFADFIIALPFLLFMILFRIAFGIGPGESGVFPMLIALVLLSWPNTARLVRGQVLQIRQEGYVQAARLLGAKPGYLIFRHMIPNTVGPILVTLTFAIPMAIFTEAFLSFIGMGVAPPTPSWGSMSNEGVKNMLSSPHELMFPAIFISITVLAFNLLGDGLRDALDSRMRSRE